MNWSIIKRWWRFVGLLVDDITNIGSNTFSWIGSKFENKDKKYLERLNERLVEEINRKQEEVEFLRAQNDLLMRKVVGKEERKQVKIEDFEPIKGFIPTRIRVADLERKSRDEARKLAAEEDNAN